MKSPLPSSIAAWLLLAVMALAQETVSVRLADGFILPVGLDGKDYYLSRGFRPNGHLGEDWNGKGGGDTDLGLPVYSTAHGVVVFARDYRLGWGNVVIVRHAYLEAGEVKFVDSLYGHLHEFFVKEGQHVTRGMKIGTIGNNRGMYDAHLHFEMRKNINIGMHRSSFKRDYSNYWSPREFIGKRTALDTQGNRRVPVPINTFAPTPPQVYAGEITPEDATRGPFRSSPSPIRRSWKVDRFEDLR